MDKITFNFEKSKGICIRHFGQIRPIFIGISQKRQKRPNSAIYYISANQFKKRQLLNHLAEQSVIWQQWTLWTEPL